MATRKKSLIRFEVFKAAAHLSLHPFPQKTSCGQNSLSVMPASTLVMFCTVKFAGVDIKFANVHLLLVRRWENKRAERLRAPQSGMQVNVGEVSWKSGFEVKSPWEEAC